MPVDFELGDKGPCLILVGYDGDHKAHDGRICALTMRDTPSSPYGCDVDVYVRVYKALRLRTTLTEPSPDLTMMAMKKHKTRSIGGM